MKIRWRLAAGATALALAAGVLPAQPAVPGRSASTSPPNVAREMRGVWIASVSNIDWPVLRGLSATMQQEQLRSMLDRAAQLNLNAVILQIRPAADALYPSELEPWSEYLTGRMGQPPDPFYDPLAFAIREAHARGLELHAWFNPFRARHPSARSEIAPSHVSRTRPELVRRYGTHLWLDPGDDAVQDYSIAVMLDVVRRYDIDGVHIDDYFYPYKERDSTGAVIDFPDSSTWERYRRGGGTLSRDDWRRYNVDRFVERLYREVKAEKATVRVGVSPIGIWRPGHPPEIRGFDAYQEIYADARKWLLEGWLDYFAPQLYWPVAQREQSYPVLLRWWVEQNAKGRHIWVGNIPSRVASSGERSWPAAEITEQIRLTRAQPGAGGNIHFSMRALMQNRGGLSDSLATALYAAPALVPATRWLDATAPARPGLRLWMTADEGAAGELTITFNPGGPEPPWLWVVRSRFGAEWRAEVLPGWRRSATIAAPPGWGRPADEVAISMVDRAGNEGPLRTRSRGGP